MTRKNIVVTGASRGAQTQSLSINHYYLIPFYNPETETLTLWPCSTGIGHAIATHLLSPALSCNVLLAARSIGPLEEIQSSITALSAKWVTIGNRQKNGRVTGTLRLVHAALPELRKMNGRMIFNPPAQLWLDIPPWDLMALRNPS